jgi:orotate phosphoribosyltransferase
MEVFLAMAFCQLLDQDNEMNCVRAVFAEKTENGFEIRRGIELFEQEEVIVVEDVVTTGGSAKKVLELVKKLGAKPIAVASIIDRSGGTVDFGLPFYSLLSLEIETWTQDDCILCKQGLPLVKPGIVPRFCDAFALGFAEQSLFQYLTVQVCSPK